MEDHNWSLRSWDQDGVAVVKLYCGECRSLVGGSSGKHDKNTISNLFCNFQKSHLMSAGHIRNYCRQKGMKEENHPQARSLRSNAVELTGADHKRMIEEGIETLKIVNQSIDERKPTFQLIGDLEDPI